MVLDFNLNLQGLFSGCCSFTRKKKITYDIDLDSIKQMDVSALNKIKLLANQLAEISNVIYINAYRNGELINIYLRGSDIYKTQTLKNLMTLPIFYKNQLIGQCGIGDLSNEEIPDELTKICKYLGELISETQHETVVQLVME